MWLQRWMNKHQPKARCVLSTLGGALTITGLFAIPYDIGIDRPFFCLIVGLVACFIAFTDLFWSTGADDGPNQI